jgi:hypothetical protein
MSGTAYAVVQRHTQKNIMLEDEVVSFSLPFVHALFDVLKNQTQCWTLV